MKKLYLLSFAIMATTLLFAQYQYPATKTVDSSDTYFGINYKDPYRWLENLNAPEVNNWFKTQADYTNGFLSKLSGRNELIAEWKEIDKKQVVRINPIDFINGRLFIINLVLVKK